MQDELQIKQNKNGRFVWQIIRTSKTVKQETMRSGKDVSWATKHGTRRGFQGHIQAAERLIQIAFRP